VTGDQTAAALFQGHQLVAAVAEERLNRQKRSRSFPKRAVRYCLESGKLRSLDEVDYIVIPWNPAAHMKRINMSGFTNWRRYDPEWLYIVPNQLMDLLEVPDSAATIMDLTQRGKSKLVYINHHQAHLGWSFASPFEDAAVAVIDEYGEATSFSLGRVAGNQVTIEKELPFPHSLGVFYATFTQFLGFAPNSDEWKVMGAAAYGDPQRYLGKIREIITYRDGEVRLNQDYFEFANTRFAGYYSGNLPRHLGLAPRSADDPLEQEHYDLAAACQAVFEEALFSVLRWLYEKVRLPRLVMNGGCCMNSLANGKVGLHTPFQDVFISPAPADNGACIGGPLWLLHTLAGERASFRVPISPYTGPSYDQQRITDLLTRYKLSYRESQDVCADTVEMLCEGRIVGWFQGRMEFGERALGNRSILADPRDEGMKDKINRSVKYRESFRPFAPSIPADAASAYFDLPAGADSRYMDKVFPVRTDKRSLIPAVVHRDGTGRLQIVRRDDNELFYRLLHKFGEKTGVPVLLNTSFNLNGEPIVESPEDALRTYLTSGIDAVVLGNYILEKAPRAEKHRTSA
jgi:carbamoyltransferase